MENNHYKKMWDGKKSYKTLLADYCCQTAKREKNEKFTMK